MTPPTPISQGGVTHVPDEVSAGVVTVLQVAVETSATNIKELKEVIVDGLKGLNDRLTSLEEDKVRREAIEPERARTLERVSGSDGTSCH